MNLINLLQILLILISVLIVINKDNLKAIIYFSVFSLISASLYYLLKSPDLALAEAAIGSAIIPFIFIISISKQREFLVISHLELNDEFLDDQNGKGYKILSEFAKHYNLKLTINKSKDDEIYGIFRSRNVDLIVEKKDKYIFKGKKTSILMSRLEKLTKDEPKIEFVKIEEGEKID